MTQDHRWRVWVDTGGTFTDCLAVDDTGRLHRQKILSNSALRGTIEEVVAPTRVRVRTAWQAPADFIVGFTLRILNTKHSAIKVVRYDPDSSTIAVDRALPDKTKAGDNFEVGSDEEAPVLAARLTTGTPGNADLPPIEMRLGTTRGTNALLERDGARVAVFVTQGFRDLLEIGDQTRPDLFSLDIHKPELFYEAVVEVPERLSADGTVLVPLQLDRLAVEVHRLIKSGVRSGAIALMHSYSNPVHENELAEWLLEAGFEHVSVSSDLAPFIKILPRAETTVVNAYLHRVIHGHLESVGASLGGGVLHVMTSAGGLVRPVSYRPKDSLLSGPAGGVVGAALAGRRSGFDKVITFDMGGTSTDVARFDGDYDYVFEHDVGDAHLVAPALAIESVASGGGSICRYHRSELQVGPESAGADPGPACYGAGGPLTLTDVNLLLGRLDAQRFDIPIDIEAARKQFERLCASTGTGKDGHQREALLEGLQDIADERMADAIRGISIRKGYDAREYALVAFGGAGGQHACGVADRLGIDRIVLPVDASLLSALGLGHAVLERFSERQILQAVDEGGGELSGWINELSATARADLEREGVEASEAEIRRVIVKMRFAGQESTLDIDYDGTTPLEKSFESKYRGVFGYWPAGRRLEIESIRVVASVRAQEVLATKRNPPASEPGAMRPARAWFDGEWRSVASYERDDMRPGSKIEGPALVFERYTVNVIESGWTAQVDDAGAMILVRARATSRKHSQPELVRVELFTHRFEGIACDMGEMLRRTALSTNVKERLDFSCAVLDHDGGLVANAPHIPVHLGAIGMCVRGVRDAVDLGPGDIAVTNHPAHGGSHLPDVTVVMPVHLADGRLLAYVANRAHHAEIGGVTPGSMPPNARSLAEEGVVIPPFLLFKGTEARWEELRRLFTDAPFPTRAIEENIADLNAAVAAVRAGADALLTLASEHGIEAVDRYMEALKHRAATRVRTALRGIPDGVYEAVEHLDDGSPLHVRIHIKGEEGLIDFAGSAGVHPGNLNTTRAVVNSVVIYLLRLLVREPLPLNEGLMSAITIEVPPGMLNPKFADDPLDAPAVFGGNVETSQRLTDTLLKALGLAACSQGTMNNVVFGTGRYHYYETVCGGAGATSEHGGASAVHTHMTNTRATDPEILEHRYPVRLERFEVRAGSGGDGDRRGGDGAVREMTFLEPMSLSVLGQHRHERPYGLCGGEPGAPASQAIVRSGGEVIELGSADAYEVEPGDRLILETPGGGGCGGSVGE